MDTPNRVNTFIQRFNYMYLAIDVSTIMLKNIILQSMMTAR